MELYLILFVVFVYLFVHKSDSEKNRAKFVNIVTTVLILVAGLRHQCVGNDTINYLNNFDAISNESWKTIFNIFVDAYLNPNNDIGKDPAIMVLNKIISIFVTNHAVYLTLMASIFLLPLGEFLKRNTNSMDELLFAYSFYLALYYGYLPNSAVRQSIAIAFVLIGCMYYQNKGSRWWFLVFILMGSFFHKSALISTLLIGATYLKNPRKILALGLPVFLLMLYFYEPIGLLLSSQSEIYSMYSGSYFAYRNKPFIVLVLFILLYLITLYKSKLIDRSIEDDTKKQFLFVGTMLTIAFVPLVRLDPSLIRITGYFVFWLILLVPESLKKYSKTYSPIIFWGCILLFVYKAYKSGLDYSFFWQEMQRQIN